MLISAFFPSVECFKGSHITLAIISAISSVFIVLFALITKLIYFECWFESQDFFSKTDSFGEILLLFYKIAIVILTTVFSSTASSSFLSIFIVLFLSAVFIYFYRNQNFNNLRADKLNLLKPCINVWTGVILLLFLILGATQFELGLIVWVGGIPLVGCMVYFKGLDNYELLLVNSDNFLIVDEALKQLYYLTTLVNMYKTEKQCQVLLDGFLD